MRIKPFAAIRPEPGQAAQVASLPYDVVDTNEARSLAADNPLSFLHVVRSEIDLPEGTDPYSDAVYAKAQENYRNLIADRVLRRHESPRVFLYRQVRDHREQIGLVCCCHIEDYTDDVIRKHEKTRRQKEDDRTRHVLTINANSGPVFMTYRDDDAINAHVELDTNRRPIYHFNADDGVTHTAWEVQDAEPYVRAFARVPFAYIADGHHRAASAARAALERKQQNPQHKGDEEYNWFLAALFPASQLSILPYNRVVTDLNGKGADDVLREIALLGRLEETSDPVPHSPGSVCFSLGETSGGWWKLTLPAESIDRSDPIASLDVALLQDRVLTPILGIGDPRTDDRIDFVGGIRGASELEKRVDSGKAAIAFSMHPTTVQQLMSVADAGLVMPPKSTWFEPKLRSGLFLHELD